MPSAPALAVEASPASTPHPNPRRGGPLEFSLNGNVTLGENSLAATRTDLLGNTVSQAATQTNSAVGLYAELRRRTGSSTTDFRIPIGFSQTGTQIGNALFEFSTPHYALLYGTQPVNLFGQIPLGATLRGPGLVLPLPAGDLTLYGGPALGADLEVVHLQGLRARRLVGRSLFELGYVRSTGAASGSASTLLGGVAASRGGLAFVGEFALQRRRSAAGDLGGFASQIRIDSGDARSNWTYTFRRITDRFLAYGAGEAASDTYHDLGYRATGAAHSLSTDVSFETFGTGSYLQRARRSSLAYGGQIGATSYQVQLQEQLLAGDQPAQWSGAGGLQVAFPVLRGYALLGTQLGRTSVAGSSPTGTVQSSAQFSRAFGPLSLQVGMQTQRQSNEILGVSRLATTSFGAQRSFGRTALGYTYTVSRTRSAFADALQRTPQFTLARQISPALQLQLSYGTQSLRDFRTPSNGGRTRLFSIAINAPFGFGNGVVQGRIDPRLPAIVSGRVLSDLGDNASIASLAPGGVANVAIVLDGTEVQRTDLDGNFQFSFVRPGQHQLRVESSSLPRGLTADQPISTIDVEGGQTAQVYFRIGDFGGIAGHVFGRDAGGGRIPLSNVMLRVDGAQYSQTDADGAYGFGRLRSGPHTIAIVENSIPAFASFDQKALVQKVEVRDGAIAPLDFVAQPLGSIAGTVVYDPLLGPPYDGGVQNAYVVAEPGEHAAITNDDGSFIIDNLPPGTYAVSVDPETVADEVAPEGDPLSVALAGNDHYEGARLVVGRKQKGVVFSFLAGGASGASARFDEKRLPPGGTTGIVYTATSPVKSASAEIFGKTFALSSDDARLVWRGTVDVPADAKAGTYEASVRGQGISTTATAALVVDPHLPIVILQVTPANVAPGQYASVRARFLVDVRQGDSIAWSDGSTTVLGKPVAGRVFTFALHVTLRPLYGTLLTRRGRLPIKLL